MRVQEVVVKLATIFVVKSIFSRIYRYTGGMEIHGSLLELGLTPKQIDIYLLLLQGGSLRVSDMVRALAMPRSSVYESLKGLFEFGLIEEVVENSFKRIRAYPLSAMRRNLEEKIKDLEEKSSRLDEIEKTIAALPGNDRGLPTVVRYYKGRAGARQLLWNTLKSTDRLYVYSEWGRGQYVGMEFYRTFVRESRKRDIKEHVLTNSLPRVIDSIRTYVGTDISRAKVETIRALDAEQVTFKGETFMYDNIYAQIYLKDEQITGFEIESQQFIDTQRAIFDMLWNSATPVSSLL